MIGLIWGQTATGIIGVDNELPWAGKYRGDLRRFKRVTMGSTVVMGRKTWESIGKPLPGRINVVISSTLSAGADVPCSVIVAKTALQALRDGVCAGRGADLWFIGGAKVYEAAMQYAEVLDVTYVPDRVETEHLCTADPSGGLLDPPCLIKSDVVYAPIVDEAIWDPGELLPHEDEPALTRRLFRRRGA